MDREGFEFDEKKLESVYIYFSPRKFGVKRDSTRDYYNTSREQEVALNQGWNGGWPR